MEGTTVDTILQEFRDDILNNVNAKECAPELRRQRVIAESTETDIERARGVRKASGILYDHLRMNCTYEQIVVFSQVLMKVDDGLGKTKNVGYRLHARIQESGAVASEQKVSQDESQLHPATPKVEVKTDLPRKRHRLSTQEPVAKKLLHDYTALKRDHLVQDISDLNSESDPKDIIKLLYCNALATISDLLKPHLKDVKKAAYRLNDLELHHVAVGEGIIESADSIDSLLRQMSVTKMWHETRFLRKAIASIPQSESDREVAEAILFHYNQHLAIYKQATRLKDAISKESETEEEAKVPVESTELVPLKITSRKDFDSFSCEDCYILQVRGLEKAYGIPEEKIICREVEDGHSTTITFLIPRQYSHNVIQRSGRLNTIWILLELDIIEVSIPGVFTFMPSVGCFLAQLRGSKPFTADLLGVTEVLPYQTYCLLDPDTKEPLSGRPLSTKRIEQHWDSHGKRKQPQSAEGASQSKKLFDSPSDTPKHLVERTGRVVTMRAEEVLDQFRETFISVMDADAVVHELHHKKIINRGDLNLITRNPNPEQKNQILHQAMKQKCTDEALMIACDIIIADNAKMAALAEAMKSALVSRTGLAPTPAPGAAAAQKQTGEEDYDGPEKPKPKLAIITANGTEQNVVRRYLKLKPLCGRVYAELMGCDWKHDPFLKEMKVDITTHDPVDIYDVFTIGEVMGVHVKCTRIGPGGAQDTTSDLLKKASEEEWPLKVIFVVGCCGVSMSDAKKMQDNWRGTVLLSEQMEDYLDTGKAEEGGLLPKARTYNLCGTWVNWLSEESICQPALEEESQRDIPVERVDKYLSGPLVIKSEEEGNKYRGNNCRIAGIEMEGAMVYTTVDRSAMKDTKVAVVKGISDYAGSDKNTLAKSVVFGKETAVEIDDKARQEVATFHAITLVTRCVASNAKCL